MSDRVPIDMGVITELMRNPIIIRIVTILDITSLSILELFEYGLTLKDINYSMANAVVRYDRPTRPIGSEESNALGIPLAVDYYYNFLNSKVKLTEMGLYILESIKSNQLGNKSAMPEAEPESHGADPRHVPDIG
jgi:hypothetical protein